MNLLCPNCQKMLTVPEQYAGQLMKCPLCSGTFTVPALSVATVAAPEPSPPPAAPTPPATQEPPQNVYSLRDDGQTAPAPATPPAAPTPQAVTPEPSPRSIPALAPETSVTTTPAVSEGYRSVRTLWFSPRVLPYIAPVCLLLVFFLTFANWLEISPGGLPMITANAWGAAFGYGRVDDPALEEAFAGDALEGHKLGENPFAGASWLAIFYLLLLIMVVLPVTLASVVLEHVHIALPPGIQSVMPWRWGIVAAANLILFLFLALQLALGFQMEANYKAWAEKTSTNPDAKKAAELKANEVRRAIALEADRHTWQLHLVVLLHLVIITSAILTYWIEQRGPGRPLPNIQWRW